MSGSSRYSTVWPSGIPVVLSTFSIHHRIRRKTFSRRLPRQISRVEVLVMSRRFGHQAALVAGMDYSDGDALIMLDFDLQHPPELIPDLLRHWEDGADIVQTVRQEGGEFLEAQTRFVTLVLRDLPHAQRGQTASRGSGLPASFAPNS